MTKNRHLPKRRFKEFGLDTEWELKKLGDLGSVEMCKRIFKYETSDKYEIPFYKIGTFGKQADSYISKKKFKIYKNSFPYPKKGDLLISASGSIGNVVEYRGEDAYFQDSNIVWLNHSGRVCNTFLKQFYSIASWEGIEGTTIKRLYNKNILETKIFLPTIQEQQVIGKFFQTIDSLITLHQHKLDKLKNLKKSYLAELFPVEGERVPKRRFLGFEGEWEEKKLGEITTYRNGTGHEEKQSRFGKYELVNLNSISIDGGLKPSGRFIEEASETLMKNDLVMVLSDVAHGDLLGRVAVIPENDKFVLNQRVALLRHNGIVDIKYLFSFINAHQKYFKLQGAGSSQLNLSRDSVENFEVALPSVEEQKTIGNFLEKLDKSISLQQQKLDKLKDLKKAYLNELFV